MVLTETILVRMIRAGAGCGPGTGRGLKCWARGRCRTQTDCWAIEAFLRLILMEPGWGGGQGQRRWAGGATGGFGAGLETREEERTLGGELLSPRTPASLQGGVQGATDPSVPSLLEKKAHRIHPLHASRLTYGSPETWGGGRGVRGGTPPPSLWGHPPDSPSPAPLIRKWRLRPGGDRWALMDNAIPGEGGGSR